MIDSRQHQMRTYEVMLQSLHETGNPRPPEDDIRTIGAILHEPNVHLHQFGNSVFLVLEPSPGKGVLSMYNVDTHHNLVQNCIAATHWVFRTLGLHEITFSYDNPTIHTLAQMMVDRSGMPGLHLQSRRVHGKPHDTLFLLAPSGSR
ncbi:MAG: hypothetical protein WC829_01420 [Hyphomicrobium sp.]|jgi:hypothetical protein